MNRSALSASIACALLTLAACQGPPPVETEQQSQARPSAGAASADPAAPQPLAAHSPTEAAPPPSELPPDHPPIGAASQGAIQLPPVPIEAGRGEAALAWQPPAGWVAEPPTNSMRRAQYRVPGPGGDAECVVFYFGPGQGGAPMENAQRWASQFTDASGQPAVGTMKTRVEQVGDVRVLFVETTGTYHAGSMMGMGQVVAKPDWALLGAVAEGADANWFFKFTGPTATVEAERAGFDAMLRSIHRGG